MKILAIETATIAGSIAVVDDNAGLIAEIKLNVKVAYAERLMSSIDWLLKASGIPINDIDAFAVSIGPGSFTGLRIGLSTAKGFAFATGKQLVPIETLDAFARTLPFCPHFICPMLDARKNEVYAGLYKWENGSCIKIIPETAANPQDFLKKIAGSSGNKAAVFTGEGAKIYRKYILDTLGSRAFFAPDSKMSPSASGVAEIAIEKIKNGVTSDAVSLTPFYIRKPEAETHWKQ